MQPRFFIRRGFAFLIDFTLVAILVGFLAYLINGLTGSTRMVAPSIASYSICSPIKTRTTSYLSSEKMRGYFSNTVAEGDTQTRCIVTQMGLTSIVLMIYSNTKTVGPFVSESKSVSTQSDNTVQTTITTNTGPSYSVTRSVSIAKDQNGQIINPFPGDALLLILLPLIAAAIVNRFSTTPGKKIVGLQVTGMDPKRVDFFRAVKRETSKLSPLILVGIFYLAVFLLTDPSTAERDLQATASYLEFLMNNFVLFAVFFGLISVSVFWWQIGSFVRWNGQAYWDRLADTQVVKLM